MYARTFFLIIGHSSKFSKIVYLIVLYINGTGTNEGQGTKKHLNAHRHADDSRQMESAYPLIRNFYDTEATLPVPRKVYVYSLTRSVI